MKKDRYFAESRSWAVDREASDARSRQRAWLVAGAAVTLALVEGLALILLLPLKTIVPMTVLVDRQTGYVQALDPKTVPPVTANAALIQSLLVQYVEAREGFDIGSVQSAYRKVGLWSADSARSTYLSAMRPANPESPFARLPRAAVVDAVVKSVSPIGPQVALVRFDTVRRDTGAGATPSQPWAAIVRYRFSPAGMSTADRFQNPLGFQVVRYRKDPEALPQTATPYSTAPSATASAPTGAPVVLRQSYHVVPAVPLHPFTSAGPLRQQPTSFAVDARSVPLGSPFQPATAAQQ